MSKTITLVRHVEGKKTDRGRSPNHNSFSQLMTLKDYFKNASVDRIIISERRACTYTIEQLFPGRKYETDERLGTDVLMKSYHRRRSGIDIYPLAAGTEEQFVELFATDQRPNRNTLQAVIDEQKEGHILIMTHGGVLLSYLQAHSGLLFTQVVTKIPCGSCHELSFS